MRTGTSAEKQTVLDYGYDDIVNIAMDWEYYTSDKHFELSNALAMLQHDATGAGW